LFFGRWLLCLLLRLWVVRLFSRFPIESDSFQGFEQHVPKNSLTYRHKPFCRQTGMIDELSLNVIKEIQFRSCEVRELGWMRCGNHSVAIEENQYLLDLT
jgi:hypothetical protein